MNPQKTIIRCVDDEAANLKLLEKLLVPRGNEVVGAARPEEKARAQIRSLAGTHFDPMVVEMFLKLQPGLDA